MRRCLEYDDIEPVVRKRRSERAPGNAATHDHHIDFFSHAHLLLNAGRLFRLSRVVRHRRSFGSPQIKTAWPSRGAGRLVARRNLRTGV